MTPRQEAAARKKIAKLQAMWKRAMVPTQKRIDKSAAAHRKACARLCAAQERREKPLRRKLDIITSKFDKRISAIARKL